MPPRRRSLESRPGSLFRVVFLAGTVLAVVLIARWFESRKSPAGRDEAIVPAVAESTRVPLPLKRVSRRSGGELVLEAIEAAGGYEAWRAHERVSFRLESVFFAGNGALLETRAERCVVEFGPPVRVRMESLDGSSVTGFGAAGAWGAGRRQDGRLDRTLGPGALEPSAIRQLVLDAAWVSGLPFNLGDSDAEFGEPVSAVEDTLIRLPATWKASAGDSAGRSVILGFDPESAHILEVLYIRGSAGLGTGSRETGSTAGAENDGMEEETAEQHLLSLRGYTDFGGTWRPVRRILYLADSMGRAIRPISEQRLSEVTWDPPVTPDFFEPPPSF